MTVVERIVAERARAHRAILVTDGASGVAVAIALLTLGAILLRGGRWLALPAWIPFAWWALAVALVVFAVRRVPRRLATDATNEALARATEQERGLRNGALVGLVQLASRGGALIDLQSDYIGGIVGGGALAPRHGRRLAFAALGAVGATVVAAVGGVVSTAQGADGWRALLHPIAAARGTLLDSLSLRDTPASIVRGDSLTAIVDASGRRRVSLSWRATGSVWHDTTLVVTDGRARLALGSIDAPLTLVANDGRSESDSLAVAVFERPFAGDVAVRAIYPQYLGRASEVLTVEDVIRVPEGTTLDVMSRAAGLSRLLLANERDTVSFALEAGRARGRVVASASATWRWSTPTTGADLPPSLSVDVIPDSAPRIEIVAPSRDTLVTPGDAVRLLVAATDDHGLRNVWLRIWNERADGTKDGEHSTQLADVSGGRWIGELELDLTASKLRAGDATFVVAQARDGAPWGRNGESRRLELRVPTADARRESAMRAADSAVARAGAAASAQKSLEKRTAEAARSSVARADQAKTDQRQNAKDNTASFEAQERARELIADQKALGERMQELSKQADRLSKELQNAGVMDSSISSELKEAQRLLREAMTPEIQKQLRDLEAQRQQMSGDEMQDALNKLQDPQQNMREALEKAREMLSRAALEGRMQSVADEAKELAQQQKELAQQKPPADSGKAADRSASAKELADRAKAVQQDVQKLAERLNKEQAQAAKDGVEKAAEQTAESLKKMEEAVKQAMSELGQKGGQGGQGQGQQGQQQQQQGQQGQQQQQGQKGQQDAKSAAEQAAEAMKSASESLGQARQAQVNSWKQEITEALDRSIQETQQMARQQEQLGQQARDGASTQLRSAQGALQQGVQQTADRLSQQAQKSALISPNAQRAMDAARQSVDQATRDLNDGAAGQQLQRSMQDAADALRQAAASMSRDRERAGNSETASGLPEMMKQMRDMAGQQAQLNGAAAQMLPNLQQVGDGAAQKEAVRPLAERQRQLAQKLEDAADADPTKRAEALAREAKQIAQQLERGELDRSVVERQSQLFRRMLDAGRTLEQDERDESGKREAKSGQGVAADAPKTGTMRGDPAVQFREPTWKELTGLTAEDRQLIIEYFRRLNAKKQ